MIYLRGKWHHMADLHGSHGRLRNCPSTRQRCFLPRFLPSPPWYCLCFRPVSFQKRKIPHITPVGEKKRKINYPMIVSINRGQCTVVSLSISGGLDGSDGNGGQDADVHQLRAPTNGIHWSAVTGSTGTGKKWYIPVLPLGVPVGEPPQHVL